MSITVWTGAGGFRQTLLMSKNLFFVGLILTASGLISPPLALLAGLLVGQRGGGLEQIREIAPRFAEAAD